MRVTREKAHLFSQKLHFFFLKLPAFRKKTNASITKPPKHGTLHLPSCRILPPVGKGRHLTIKSKGQRNEGLNPFRTKGGIEFFVGRFTPHTRKKEGSFAFSRSSFHHSDLFCYICTLNCCAHFVLTHSASPSRLQVGAAAPTGFALKSDRRSPCVEQERYCTRNK